MKETLSAVGKSLQAVQFFSPSRHGKKIELLTHRKFWF